MVDNVEIRVIGGKGGDGMVSFRREKYLPFGGPSGGDAGRGGDVYVEGHSGLNTLWWFRRRKYFQAEDGKGGGSNNKRGKNGEDLVLKVPVGTQVFQKEGQSKLLRADIEKQGDRVMVARGGRGGWGNARFATPTNQAPVFAKQGEAGEERELTLELKLIADVGIIGFPSVGKSTLLRAASAAKPEVAQYAFTTKEPVLGVVEVDFSPFVLAEIPGLVEGAHAGRGLGDEFLRHAERTRILLHLLDGTSASPTEDMQRLNEELWLYQDGSLMKKPQVIAVNKIDISEVRERVPEISEELRPSGKPIFFISADRGEGVPELMRALARMLTEKPGERVTPMVVFRPRPKDLPGRAKE